MLMIYLSMIDTPEDEAKFEKIYNEYAGLMHSIAYEILENQEDAEDAVQQAFIKIAQNMHKVEEPISLKTKGFVTTITQNRALDFYRHKHLHPETAYDDDRTMYHSMTVDKDLQIKHCLLQLPPRYKQALVLKHVYGLSTFEIAKIMNISFTNAMKLLQRAKKKFIEFYEKEGR